MSNPWNFYTRILGPNPKESPLTLEELDSSLLFLSSSLEITGSITSSYALTASYAQTAQTASFATSAQTASFVTTAQTASFVANAQTASFATLAQTASFATTAQTASFVTLAQTASFVANAQTASYINPLKQDIQLTGSLIVDEGYIANFPTNSINLTIPSGYNALLVGPIYNSASINVSTGSRLVIL